MSEASNDLETKEKVSVEASTEEEDEEEEEGDRAKFIIHKLRHAGSRRRSLNDQEVRKSLSSKSAGDEDELRVSSHTEMTTENSIKKRGDSQRRRERPVSQCDDLTAEFSIHLQDESEIQISDDEHTKNLAKHPRTIQNAYFVAKPFYHLFQYSAAKAHCNVCRRLSSFGAMLTCSVCKYSVHEKCTKKIETPCQRCNYLYKNNISQDIVRLCQKREIPHHWIEGNYNRKCEHCKKNVGKTISTKLKENPDIRCSICKRVVHALCKDSISKECDLGELRRYRLCANEIYINMNMDQDPTADRNILHNQVPTRSPSSSLLQNHGILTPSTSFDKTKSYLSNSVEIGTLKKNSGELGDLANVATLLPEHVSIFPRADDHQHLLIFVNPKSGGNLGAKLLRKFQSMFNPWQVFDIIQCKGPEFGLSIFKNVPNFRILVCGGDGTVGWVMSTLDKFPIEPLPPIGVLPLGTGNDLAQILGWPYEYSNQSLRSYVQQTMEADVVPLDRWSLDCTSLENIPKAENSVDKPPLNVINNYFSFGIDATAVLAFHIAREKDPSKFNSRWGNRLYYGYAGGKQFFRRNDFLGEYCTLVCDGKDYKEEMKKMKGLIFLNITSYAGGVNPWGTRKTKTDKPQSCSDGLIEVIGIEKMADVSKMMVGLDPLTRLTQCKSAILTTESATAMQIDGEPCFIAPSKLEISFKNQMQMLKKQVKKHSTLFYL